MRFVRCLIVVAGATVLLVPTTASANGGAYIELDGTHFVPGRTAVAEVYVSIPKPKRDLLDEGPFYAYLLPRGAEIREGRPIPAQAIRVGTFAVEHEKGSSFELRASITVPDVPGAYYSVALCNDPCTVAGFREQLLGTISVVATAREGELLTENTRLQSRAYGLRRQIRKAERQNDELESAIVEDRREVLDLRTKVGELEDELEASTAAASSESRERPLVDGWAVAGVLVGMTAIAAAMLFRGRRRPPIAAAGTEAASTWSADFPVA